MTNQDIIQSIRAVKERLFTKGWQKHDGGLENGPNCILGAIHWETGGYLTEECRVVTKAVAAGMLGADHIGSRSNLIGFNDRAGTTFDDIIDYLDFRVKELESSENGS